MSLDNLGRPRQACSPRKIWKDRRDLRFRQRGDWAGAVAENKAAGGGFPRMP